MRRPPAPANPGEVIRSAANPTLKFVRSLGQRKMREAERAFVVEGQRAVADALGTGATPTVLVLREGVEVHLPVLDASSAGLPRRVVAEALFDGLADTVTPQGVLAVFPYPVIVPPATASPLYLVLDRLRDPGNLGTLLRAAAGAGVTAVYLSAGSVDPFNPKVVRAGMGAHFRVPIRSLAAEAIEELVAVCPLRVVAEAGGSLPYDALDWTQPAALVVGSEATGVGEEARSLGTKQATIPLAPGVESLNAAVAGAVILFEAARQRRRGPGRGAKPARSR